MILRMLLPDNEQEDDLHGAVRLWCGIRVFLFFARRVNVIHFCSGINHEPLRFFTRLS